MSQFFVMGMCWLAIAVASGVKSYRSSGVDEIWLGASGAAILGIAGAIALVAGARMALKARNADASDGPRQAS